MNVLASCVFAAWRQLSLSTRPFPRAMGRGPIPFPQEESQSWILPGLMSLLPCASG